MWYFLLKACVKGSVEVLKLNFLVIQEQLKMKDQSLRKLQQEMDSLTFRNQQLAKRVELLQDELALSEARGKKNKVCANGKKPA